MDKKKLKEPLVDGCKGIAIGVSMIIPGFSGGTIAVLMNIYDKILEAITGIFRHFKSSLLVLIPLLIGAVIGFAGLVFPLQFGLSHIPLIVISLFVGFIIGGIPFIYKKVQGKENPLSIIIGILAMGLVISLCFIQNNQTLNLEQLNAGTWFYLLLAGILSSVALVAPGISGSMTLMILGVYTSLIDVLKDLMSFNNVGHNLLVLVPLAIGLIVGFVLMSILMKYLLKKHTTSTYFAILGFIIGSIVTIYYLTITDEKYPVRFDAMNISLSIVVLLVGIVATYFLENLVSRKEEKAKEEPVSDED